MLDPRAAGPHARMPPSHVASAQAAPRSGLGRPGSCGPTENGSRKGAGSHRDRRRAAAEPSAPAALVLVVVRTGGSFGGRCGTRGSLTLGGLARRRRRAAARRRRGRAGRGIRAGDEDRREGCEDQRPEARRRCHVRPYVADPHAGFGHDARVDGYEAIDVGDGARLERFGAVVVARPHPGASGPRLDPDAWDTADLVFDRTRGWRARSGPVPNEWIVATDGLRLACRPTATGQVGLFPEHRSMLPWLVDQASPEAEVLHLFAYTGLVTLALAAVGARVTHVDAARPAVAWARANAETSGLADRPIRWLVEDVRRYVEREARRGRRYEGIVLDPPSYGHGASGTAAWRIERDLPELLDRLRELRTDGDWLLLTAHTEGVRADDLAALLEDSVGGQRPVDRGELAIDARSGARLVLGAYARIGDRG